ncbi:MAG: rRNA ((1402)-2-O)-methyltransferase [Nevskia sp.]|nr:rRNA ((1402)-2-O)-methyltransferase [Nevskia sp.]
MSRLPPDVPAAHQSPVNTGSEDTATPERAVRAGALYVVATPIGNLGDLSPRARDVLAGVDRIAAEDTRTTGVLLAHCGLRRPLVALHEHNEDRIAEALIAAVARGESLALVSDAGTPLVSDPGYALVRAARAQGVPVYAVPGPCAVIAALSICGLATDRFTFAGFLPSKSSARRARLQEFLHEPRTVIVYESAHRIGDSLADLVAVLGEQRQICLAREISKRFEESITASAAAVLAWQTADAHRSLGEFVLVIEGVAAATDDANAERVLRLLLGELSPSRAARLAAEITGAPRKQLYELALRAGASNQNQGENEDNDAPK